LSGKFDREQWLSYTTADELADDLVNSITIDSEGVLWIGTWNGASRFNGSEWRKYTTENGLVHNNVQSIEIGADDATWFGTEGGLSGLS